MFEKSSKCKSDTSAHKYNLRVRRYTNGFEKSPEILLFPANRKMLHYC